MENCNTGHIPKLLGAAKLTVIGSAFVGVGWLMNSYVPAFHAPVTWVDKTLRESGKFLSNTPGARPIFRNNPLTNSTTLTHFLAVNIVESAFIGGILVTGGVALKARGVKASEVERFLATKHGERPRS